MTMIKKNLFLLVSFYFFVLQSVFIGLLRDISNFYWLAFINFVFILLLALFSKDSESTKGLKIKKMNMKVNTGEEDAIVKLEKIKKLQKKRIYKPISHIWLFIISVLAGFFVWFWLSNMDVYFQLIISVVGSSLLFFVFSLLFKFNFKKVWETKLYIVITLGLLLVYAWTSINIKISDITSIFSFTTNIETQGSTLTGDTSFVSVDGDLTGDVISLEDDNKNEIEKESLSIDYTKNATFTDVIKSLFDKNGIVLNTSKNIKFTYVPYTSSDYAYFRTAYDKRMIGKTIVPTKTLLCETYIVMKGLTEGRNVGSYKNIKTAYWNYAKNNDKLSNCKYGEYTKLGDLK